MYFGNTKTKLDHIISNGLNRMDEAVEGVIDKYPARIYPAMAIIKGAGITTHRPAAPYITVNVDMQEMARRQGEGLQNAYWHQEQLLNRAGANMQGSLNHCSAGMAAQQGARVEWLTQEQADKRSQQ